LGDAFELDVLEFSGDLQSPDDAEINLDDDELFSSAGGGDVDQSLFSPPVPAVEQGGLDSLWNVSGDIAALVDAEVAAAAATVATAPRPPVPSGPRAAVPGAVPEGGGSGPLLLFFDGAQGQAATNNDDNGDLALQMELDELLGGHAALAPAAATTVVDVDMPLVLGDDDMPIV
jgi:hypothetical protein